VLRIEGQVTLQTLNEIKNQHRNGTKQEHCYGVFSPAHLAFFVHSGQFVDKTFNRSQQRIEERLLAIEDMRHKDPERLRNDQDQREEKEYL